MYYCETESLRYGNELIKAFNHEHRLVGVGLYFGRGTGKMYLHEEIDSPEAQSELKKIIAEACPHVEWELHQPNED